jgi:TonB-linked SusC/RagA family outer membrane protein
MYIKIQEEGRVCPNKNKTRIKRILNIMRISVLLLTVGIFSLSASIYSQDAKVSIQLENKSVNDVFTAIKAQTSYSFWFDIKDVDIEQQVSLHVTDETVKSVLDKTLKSQNVDFIIYGNHIVIAQKGTLGALKNQQQGITITGTVTDEANDPLPGVNVTVKGTTIGIVTDIDGKYRIHVPGKDAILLFSYIGYATQELAVGDRTDIDVVLNEGILGIEEVVVVGYGTMRKKDLTGSVGSADLQALKGSPNVSLLQGLQGTMPGLNIGMADEAGESPSITVRGRSTISGNQSPLIILDGIVYYGNLSNINPNDIKSLDILKDASSKAIYGAQAANGVILITTKRGQNEGAPVITYNTSFSIGSPYKRLHTKNRESYLQMIQDVFWNEAYTKESGYIAVNENYNIETSAPFTVESIVKGYREGAETDWWKLGTTDATIQTHNIDIQGMTEKVNYFMSLGYDKQTNYIINDKFNRKTARINLETQVADWLKVGIQSFGSFSDFSGESPDISQLTQAGPLRMAFKEDGKLTILEGDLQNPLIGIYNEDCDKRNELFGNFYARIGNIPFLKGFSWDINYGNTLLWVKQFNSNEYAQAETGEVKKFNNSTYNYTFDNIFNYTKTFDKHRTDATLVIGRTKREYENTTARAYGMANQTLGYNDLGQGKNQFVLSDSWEETSSYQMFRLNYSFLSRYMFTGTVRRDGFSGFAKNEKTAYFPSFALGWIASEESFLNQADWLDLLKVRASYGVNGNLVTRYNSLARVTSSAAYVFGDGGTSAYGQEPSNLPNSNLKWEKTHGINLALDFGVLNNRITGNVEYYSTTTKDLIWKKALPELTGFKEIIDNIGEVANRGIEFTLNATPVRSKDFRWDLTFNYSRNKNKIVHLLGDVDGDGIEDDLISSNLFIGQPISAVYQYDVNGIYQLGDDIPAGYYAGSYRITDHSGDGALSADDRILLGMSDPSYRFSIHNNFRYKGFSLKVFLNAVQGGKNGYLANCDPFAAYTPQYISQKGMYEEVDFWTPSNPDAKFRSPSGTSSINPNVYQKRSFVRLQDVILSYDFDPNLLSKTHIAALRLFVSGKNLYTWTKWDGWDPETGSGIGYGGRPVMRHFTMGLELTLK